MATSETTLQRRMRLLDYVELHGLTILLRDLPGTVAEQWSLVAKIVAAHRRDPATVEDEVAAASRRASVTRRQRILVASKAHATKRTHAHHG